MIVDIHGQEFTVTPALVEQVQHRLHQVLSHRGDVIQRIVVGLGSTDSRRGVQDMYCLMQVRMSDALVATVVDIGPRVHDVIDRAADRLRRLVAAHLDRTPRDRQITTSSANPTVRQQVAGLAGAGRRGQIRAQPDELHNGAEIRRPRSVHKTRRLAWFGDRPARLS